MIISKLAISCLLFELILQPDIIYNPFIYIISAYKSKEDKYFLSLLINLFSFDLRIMLVTILSSGYLLYLFQNISVLYWGCGIIEDVEEFDPELTEDEKLDTDEALDRNEKVDRRGFNLTICFLCIVS